MLDRLCILSYLKLSMLHGIQVQLDSIQLDGNELNLNLNLNYRLVFSFFFPCHLFWKNISFFFPMPRKRINQSPINRLFLSLVPQAGQKLGITSKTGMEGIVE